METDFTEIDEGIGYVGYQEAFGLVGDNVPPTGIEEVAIDASVGRAAAEDIKALVSYPSGDVSLKDGFAVKSQDVAPASAGNPVRLKVIGSVFAGSGFSGEVIPGNTVKVGGTRATIGVPPGKTKWTLMLSPSGSTTVTDAVSEVTLPVGWSA